MTIYNKVLDNRGILAHYPFTYQIPWWNLPGRGKCAETVLKYISQISLLNDTLLQNATAILLWDANILL